MQSWAWIVIYVGLVAGAGSVLFVLRRSLRRSRDQSRHLRTFVWIIVVISTPLALAWAILGVAGAILDLPTLTSIADWLMLPASVCTFAVGLALLWMDRSSQASASRLRQMLAEAQRQVPDLQSRLPDLIFSLDAAGNIISAPSVAMLALGYSASELVGRQFVTLASEETRAEAQAQWGIIQSGGGMQTRSRAWDLCRSDGESVLVSVVMSARQRDAGAFGGADVIVRDIAAQQAYVRELAVHEDRERSLVDLTLTVGCTPDLDDVLQRLLDVAGHVIGYDSANVMVLRDDALHVLAARGYPDETAVRSLSFEEMAAAQLRHLRVDRQPLIVDDTLTDPNWITYEPTSYVRSYIGVPLFARDELIGVINLDSRQAHRYSEADARMLATIASHAAAAISQAQLFVQVREQATRLSRLNEQLVMLQKSSLALAGARSVEEALDIARLTVREVMGRKARAVIGLWQADGDAGQIFSLADDVRLLRALRRIGIDLESITLSRHDFPPDVVQAVRGRGYLVTHELADLVGPVVPRALLVAFQRTRGAKTFAGFPLGYGDRNVGVMVLGSPEQSLPENELELLVPLCSMAGAAIESIRLLQDLRRTSATLDRTISSSTDAIIAVGPSGAIAGWNPAAERLFGCPAAATLGRALTEQVQMGAGLDAGALLARVMSGQHVDIRETEFRTPSGASGWLAGAGAPMRDNAGDVVGSVWTLRDAGRERLITRQMMQTEKLSALGQIVAGVAHELNNPLTSVIGFSQMLRLQPVSPEVKQDIDRVIDQAKRATRIVQNLLMFAREREPELGPTDVNAILRDVVEMRAYELGVSNIAVSLDLAADLPVIMADPYQVHQVFFNLVLNAEQAIAAAGRSDGELIISSRLTEGGALRVEVRDNGPGISPDRLKRVFDPFFTTKEVGQGTGLGLSVCYGIVEEHRGEIWAESQVGRGTAFIVEFPAETAVEEIRTMTDAATERSEGDLESVPASPARILVIDDEEMITSLLDRALRRWGYEPHVVSDGQAGWRRIEAESFDLILSDLRMPGLSGEGLLARLKEARPDLVPRVVFITGDTMSAAAAGFLAAAGRPALSKPFDLPHLQQFLADTLAELGVGAR